MNPIRSGTCGGGYWAEILLGNLLDVLAPNALLKEKFREGWRSCEVKRRGMRPPKDLHRVGDATAALRSLSGRAFTGCGPIEACALHFRLSTTRAIDDDAWVFLPKPVIDGMTDAGFWVKDRRRILETRGAVVRDGELAKLGDVLHVRVELP
jgi:hypothetical protein